MSLICPHCGFRELGNVERSPNSTKCQACGTTIPANIFPLFVITGASGSGKTAVLHELLRRIPECVIFDKDLLWGRCGDQFYNNWVRIAYSIAQGGRYTLISGIIMPSDFDNCEDRNLVGNIYYLNLHCDDSIRAARLRARPAWRQTSSDWFIEEHRKVARRLLELSDSNIQPPIPTIDTSITSIPRIADSIAEWIKAIEAEYPKATLAPCASID